MITLTDVKTTFTTDGAIKTFAYNIPFLATSDLIVKTRIIATGIEALYVLDTDYSVTATNNDYSAGATITTLSGTAIPATIDLIVERKVPTTQSTEYPEASPFPAQSTEDALDKLTLLVQQLERRIEECLRVADTDGLPSRLANSVDRINKYLTFDSTGQPVASITIPSETAPSLSNPIVTTGAGAPGSAPTTIGDLYVDTTNEIPYIGIDTVASSDFVNILELIADTTPQLVADLDGNSQAITGLTSVDTTLGYKIGTAVVLNVDDAQSGTYGGKNAGVVTTGLNCTAFGRDALEANIAGANNSAFGKECLTTNITGDRNSGFGDVCLKLATGSSNSGFGFEALTAVAAGASNNGFGRGAGKAITTGDDNLAAGTLALESCVTADNNVALGGSALNAVTTAGNLAAGHGSLLLASTGHSNIGLGFQAGNALLTGDKCLILGYDGDVPSTTSDNQLNIGNVIWGSGCSGTGTTAAGQVSIGTNAPATDAILELSSTTKAFLPTRLTTAEQDDAGFTKVAGMIIYNSNTSKLRVYTGAAWADLH